MAYRKNTSTYNPPSITIAKCRVAYFAHGGVIYSVVSAPSEIFKAAIREKHPSPFKDGSTNRLMETNQLDLVSRWYLLNELSALRKPLKLYKLKTKVVRAKKSLV